MKIAIASDIHDNLPNLKKFLDFVRKERIKFLILCGDTGLDEETLKFLSDNFKGKVFLVPGNMDRPAPMAKKPEKQNTAIKIFETVGKTTISGLKIAFC
ncbi:MAG: metallophosphoesterase, partial [bacterium]|nr:metallophosphoesterase [bacterium]